MCDKRLVIVFSAGSEVESCACTVTRYEALYGAHEFTTKPVPAPSHGVTGLAHAGTVAE